MSTVSLPDPALPEPRGASRASYPPEVRARLEPEAKEIIARYPHPESALLPLLHLVQAEEGYVTPAGIGFCADLLDLTTAEVSAVVTFYTMYKRQPVGEYHVGVCTNTLCAVMGGDAIYADLKQHLGADGRPLRDNEPTPDGRVSVEHIECNAACDYAPVVMVNWEFFDNQTPESVRALVDALRAGDTVTPTRGAPLCTFRETSRILAGFPDPRPDAVHQGGSGGEPTLAGLRLARGGTPVAGRPGDGASTTASAQEADATSTSAPHNGSDVPSADTSADGAETGGASDTAKSADSTSDSAAGKAEGSTS